jgi:hypothetical protein
VARVSFAKVRPGVGSAGSLAVDPRSPRPSRDNRGRGSSGSTRRSDRRRSRAELCGGPAGCESSRNAYTARRLVVVLLHAPDARRAATCSPCCARSVAPSLSLRAGVAGLVMRTAVQAEPQGHPISSIRIFVRRRFENGCHVHEAELEALVELSHALGAQVRRYDEQDPVA